MDVRIAKTMVIIAAMLSSIETRADAPSPTNDYVPSRIDCQGSNNETLAEKYGSDQADREESHPERSARDALRLTYVLEQIAALCTPEDHYHAAMILQHSSEPEHHLLAHRLARYASERGHEKSKWLTSAAWDRYFVSRGLPQFFGTQFKWNDAKQLCLIQIDPEATNEKRASWEMDPIEDIYDLVLASSELSHLPRTRESLERNDLVCEPHVWAEWKADRK